VQSKSAYEHPQPHACFIQSVGDDLVNEGGIMDLWVREARLFKYGSGTGSNFSKLRGEGERLSGGGKSSGLMSFLKIGDRAAGAIKSGGTTRRAAKMVVVDIDHPDIEEYIDWKVKEEQKVAALVTGSKVVSRHLKAIMKACRQLRGRRRPASTSQEPGAEARSPRRQEGWSPRTTSSASSSSPARATPTSNSRSTTPTGIRRPTSPSPARTPTTRSASPTTSCAPSRPTATGTSPPASRQGHQDAEGPRALGEDRLRRLGLGRSGHPVPHHHQRVAHLARRRPDRRVEPVLGIHVPRRHGVQPRLAQPAALPQRGRLVRRRAFEHTSRLWTIVLEVSVMMAQFPSRAIAERSYEYRTLGLGYANIGGLLMTSGIPYDSAKAAPSPAPSPPS
jgi:ribonucleoside-diphosphate reductase alpha chain